MEIHEFTKQTVHYCYLIYASPDDIEVLSRSWDQEVSKSGCVYVSVTDVTIWLILAVSVINVKVISVFAV